jgi:iron complex outermembrane recepter protein
LQQNYLPGLGGYDRKVQAYSATLTGRIGDIELTAISGYNINEYTDSEDVTFGLSYYTQNLFNTPGTGEFDNNKTRKFTQEIRMSAPIGDHVDWLLGGFYTHENSQYFETTLAINPAGTVISPPDILSFPTSYQEYAAFSDVTFHLTDRFDVQLGGRESEIRQTYSSTEAGPYVQSFYGQPSPYVLPEQRSSNNAFTYLVTPRFKVSSDLMVYARLASGYRAGGPNVPGPGTPDQYSPDKTQNYEIGAKAAFLDHRLHIDASLYYIDWKNIQVQSYNPTTFSSYTGNGNGAKSQGIELSAESRPLAGLTISAWVAWDDAVLTAPFPPNSDAVGVDGDRLPYSSRFSGNLSLEEDFPLASGVTGFVGGAVAYVGNREGVFASTFATSTERQALPAYTKTDLRAGVKYDSWTANVFVNNLTDDRGVLAGGLGAFPPFAFTYIQPRTIGLNVIKTF